eukprot:COSAG02_NODE_3069_length_7427_cov_7.977211_4_plen_67_part_00
MIVSNTSVKSIQSHAKCLKKSSASDSPARQTRKVRCPGPTTYVCTTRDAGTTPPGGCIHSGCYASM